MVIHIERVGLPKPAQQQFARGRVRANIQITRKKNECVVPDLCVQKPPEI